jgi:WD40 repeat protein
VLVTSGTDGAVLAWNVATRGLQRVIERQPADVAPVIAISNDGKTLAVARPTGRWAQTSVVFRRYDLVSGRFVAPPVTLVPRTDAQTTRIAYAPDGRLFAAADGFVWIIRDDGSDADMMAHGLVGPAIAFSHDRRLVLSAVTGGPRTEYSVIDATTRAVTQIVELHGTAPKTSYGDGIAAIAISPDDKRVAFALSGHGVFFADSATGDVIGCLWGRASRLAFSQSGATLIAATGDAMEIWDARSFVPLSGTSTSPSNPRVSDYWTCPGTTPRAKLTGHEALVTDIAVSSGNDFLASSSEDGTVLLWTMP